MARASGLSFADYIEGLAFFVAVFGAALAIGWLLTERIWGHLRGSARAVAFGVLATTALIAIHLLPGVLGVLSRWTVLAAALIALAAVWRLVPGEPLRRAAPRGFERGSGRVSWVFALAGAGLLALWSLTALYEQWALPSTGIDTLTHHLPNVGAWIQHQTFWRIDQFAPFLANGNYPHHGDVIFLGALLPWENDAFVRPLNWPYLALAGVAIYAIAAELRAPRAPSVLFAAAFCAIPVVLRTAQSGAMTDMPMLAGLGAGVLFAIRHLRERRRADLVMAGLGLGLALGTKWYGVSSAVVVFVVWAGALLVLGGGLRRVAGQAAALGGVALASGGFWFLRNWIESGNPIYPAKVSLLGVTIFDAPPDPVRDEFGFTIFDYLTDLDVLTGPILGDWREALDLPALAIVLGGLTALVLALRAVRRRRDAASVAPLALAAMAVLLAAAYTVTPDTALGREGEPVLVGPNARYASPALLAGAAAAAWVAGRIGRAALVLELVAFAGVLQGLRRGFAVDRMLVLQMAVGLAVLAALGWGVARTVRGAEGSRRTVLAALTAVVVLLAGVAVGHARQRDFNSGRYASTGDEALDWVTANAKRDRKIGLAGHWDVRSLSPVWPAFGPRIENEVEYVGPTIDGQLRDYPSARAFAAALRERGFELLLVGRRDARAMPSLETKLDRWARQAGWELVARGNEASLYAPPARSRSR